MIATLGKVYIGTIYMGAFPTGARFTTDPKIEREWLPNQSMLKAIGTVVRQDYGRLAKDCKLTLTSDGNYINHAFKAYLDGLRAVRGASYDYLDYTGLQAAVAILDFVPKPTFIRDGNFVLWEYVLKIQCQAISYLDGATYTGT